MTDRDHAVLMARYNAWMNARLYAVCATLTAEALDENAGAFFGSIRRTLAHLVSSDRSFLGWFADDALPTHGREADAGLSFAALSAAREELDAAVSAWAADLSADDLARQITYVSSIDGKTRTLPKWVLVTHFFNHQTHHRGQVTTLLSQRGIDVGITDLPFVPDAESSSGARTHR